MQDINSLQVDYMLIQLHCNAHLEDMIPTETHCYLCTFVDMNSYLHMN